jgi:hypothetical protein
VLWLQVLAFIKIKERWALSLLVKFIGLSSLLFVFHDESISFATNWFDGFYDGEKSMEF